MLNYWKNSAEVRSRDGYSEGNRCPCKRGRRVPAGCTRNSANSLVMYGESNKAGRRESQVHLTLSRCGLLHAFNHYLTHGSEFDQHVAYALLGNEGKELLRKDGKARVIKVSVPGDIALNAANRYFPIDDQPLEKGQLPNLVEDCSRFGATHWRTLTLIAEPSKSRDRGYVLL